MSAEQHSQSGLPESAVISTAADSRQTVAEEDVAEAPELERGTTIGRYVVLERAGSGAMGIVYAAYDPELDRKLAIKVLRMRGSSERRKAVARTRMIREAQALAKLSHPNVIAIHDAGAFDGGVFVAMDFVDGETLDEWIERTVKESGTAREKSWRTIVEVFAQAARGLAAAHEAGLVHRDFKPSNVIVDRRGRARVLDFGLARAADPNNVPTTGEFELAGLSSSEFSGSYALDSSQGLDLASIDESIEHLDAQGEPLGPDRTVSSSGSTRRAPLGQRVTRIGATLGTPAYMSPEQHVGEDAGPQSDQFSFCVALYEALYGQAPFPGDTAASKACAVAGGELRVPPRTAVPARVREAVIRGLAVSTSDRFPDMPALLRELETAPRKRSWIWWLAASGFVAAAGSWAIASDRADSELCGGSKAKIAEVWSESSRDQLGESFHAIDKPYAEHSLVAVQSKLDDYVSAWTRDYVETCEATHRHGVQSEELLDLRMHCLERRRTELGALIEVFASADEDVVENAVEAVSDLEPSAGCTHLVGKLRLTEQRAPTASAEEIRDIERELAAVTALRRSGKYTDASERARALTEHARASGHRALSAEVTATYGSTLADEGRYVEAKAALTDAAIEAEYVGDERLLASLRTELAMVSGERLGEVQAGHVWIALAGSSIDKLGGDLALTAKRHASLAQIYDREGRHQEELAEKRAALETYLRVEDPDPSLLAAFHGNLSSVLAQLGKHEDALSHARESLSGFEELLGPDHPRTAIGHATLGLVYDYHGDYRDALVEYERAAEILEAATGPEHGRMAEVLNNLAIVHMNLGEEELGAEMFERVLRIKEHNLPAGHIEIASALGNMGGARRMLGDYQGALAYQERALDIRRAVLADDHPDLGTSLASMANTLESLERHAESLPLRKQAVAIFEKTYGHDSPSIIVDLGNLAYTYMWNDEPELALTTARRAVAIADANDARPDSSAFARIALAEAILANRGDAKEARALAEKALVELDDLPATTERELLEKMSDAQRWKLDVQPRARGE